VRPATRREAYITQRGIRRGRNFHFGPMPHCDIDAASRRRAAPVAADQTRHQQDLSSSYVFKLKTGVIEPIQKPGRAL